MTLARWRALVIAVTAAIVVGAAAAAFVLSDSPLRSKAPPTAVRSRPPLMLLTSLPLIFGEGFSLRAPASPAMQSLNARFEVKPISTTSAQELAKGKLLLMAHPPAQTAENLVALDTWVRRGGRVLLLADPLLEWPSARPLGDPLRPSPTFPDTGLLSHWGLRLLGPKRRGRAARQVAGYQVTTVSPGSLIGRCAISADRFVADCRVGKGRAVIVADADFLNVAEVDGPHNLDALIAELVQLGAN